MPTVSLHKGKSPTTSSCHKSEIRLSKANNAYEEQKVRTYWQTGEHINKHILKYSNRAEYGGRVVNRLVEDLKVDKTTLHDCVNFAKSYPVLPIYAAAYNSNGHIFGLWCDFPTRKRGSVLMSKLDPQCLDCRRTRRRIKAERLECKPVEPVPAHQTKNHFPRSSKTFTRQTVHLQIVERPTLGTDEQGLLLDLGFGIFRELEARVVSQFENFGDIVQSRPKDDAYKFTTRDGGTEKDLYTYQAYIEKILDGDTFKVRFDLGFNTWMRETLRLRGLDYRRNEHQRRRGRRGVFVQSYI